MRGIRLAACLLVFAAAQQAQASIIVETADFISDNDRTHFNGFEAIANDGTFYTGGSGPYVEDLIQVQQINGDPGNSIWVNYASWAGAHGHAWYPSGGDHGFTEISMVDGSDFEDVGFNYASGGRRNCGIMYELLQDGEIVLKGVVGPTEGIHYLGFSGGGFDTIRVRDRIYATGGKVTDHSFQALTVDNIETHTERLSLTALTPEPSSIALAGIGVMSMCVSAIKRRRQQA